MQTKREQRYYGVGVYECILSYFISFLPVSILLFGLYICNSRSHANLLLFAEDVNNNNITTTIVSSKGNNTDDYTWMTLTNTTTTTTSTTASSYGKIVLFDGHLKSSINRRTTKKNCPPEGFNALTNFDLQSYISKRWYVQRQKPVIYSGEESYCSYAQYTMDDTDPFCLGIFCEKDAILRINVKNRGLVGSVSGKENIALLSAIVPNPIKEPAKVQVSFRIVPGRTNYWIVAAGTYQDAIDGTYIVNAKPVRQQQQQQHSNQQNNGTTTTTASAAAGAAAIVYEWAIISGGTPTVENKENNKCSAGTFGKYDVRGLWMFTRAPFPPSGVLEAVSMIATHQLGLDTTVWKNVTHTGCIDY